MTSPPPPSSPARPEHRRSTVLSLSKGDPQHILITGGAGYTCAGAGIGSILCEHLLDAGHHVTPVDNLMYGPAKPVPPVRQPALRLRVRRRAGRGADAPPGEGGRRAHPPPAAIVGAPACDRDPWRAGSVNLEAIRLLNRLRSLRQLVIFYVHFAPIGSDLDKRNYIVSNQRLREAGFEARRSLGEGIQELIKGYRMVGRGRFRNV